MTSIEMRTPRSSAPEHPQVVIAGPRGPSGLAAAWHAVLRVPLLGKLAGANILVAAVAAIALVVIHRDGVDGDQLLMLAVLALTVGVAASIGLMKLALQPVARLRATLHRYAQGDDDVRIRPSLVADRDLAGVSDAVNDLLDDLMAERERVRQLARDTIRNADEERSRIARGLHDSTAQTLAALSLEARMALQLQAGQALTQQLELIRDLAVEAVEEVRDLSQTIHPRILDDLGLAAALGWLARSMRDVTGLETSLKFSGDSHRIPGDVACSLYRTAEAALSGIGADGESHPAELRLDVGPEHVVLSIRDGVVTPQQSAPRLLTMRDRLALSGGKLVIHDHEGGGRHVLAVVPLGPEPAKEQP